MTKRKGKNQESQMTLNAKQIKCLVAPARVDIVEALRLAGNASIAELAERLNRSPHSLYYHMDLLEKCGLIHVCETRRSGAREEAVYTLTASRFLFSRESNSSLYRKQMAKALRLVFRKAEREHLAAQAAAQSGELGNDEIRLLRIQVKLNAELKPGKIFPKRHLLFIDYLVIYPVHQPTVIMIKIIFHITV